MQIMGQAGGFHNTAALSLACIQLDEPHTLPGVIMHKNGAHVPSRFLQLALEGCNYTCVAGLLHSHAPEGQHGGLIEARARRRQRTRRHAVAANAGRHSGEEGDPTTLDADRCVKISTQQVDCGGWGGGLWGRSGNNAGEPECNCKGCQTAPTGTTRGRPCEHVLAPHVPAAQAQAVADLNGATYPSAPAHAPGQRKLISPTPSRPITSPGTACSSASLNRWAR